MVDKKIAINITLYQKDENKSFKLTSRRFLISMSGVTQELPLLRKLMSTALYCTSGRTKARKSELDPSAAAGRLSTANCDWCCEL